MIVETSESHETRSEGTGLIVIAGNGTVLYHNRIAKGLIERKDALFLSEGRLGFTRPEIDRSFRRLISQIMQPPTTASPSEVTLRVGGPEAFDSEYSLRLSAMVGKDNVVETILIQIIRITPMTGVQVKTRPPAADAGSKPSLALRNRYHLTPAEGRVCEAIYRLGSRQLARHEIGISENTIKSHVRNVFSKLNVSSQGELIRALAKNDEDSVDHINDSLSYASVN